MKTSGCANGSIERWVVAASRKLTPNVRGLDRHISCGNIKARSKELRQNLNFTMLSLDDHLNFNGLRIEERTTPVPAKNTAPSPGPAWYDPTTVGSRQANLHH